MEQKFIIEEDYYLEDARVVFTKNYLIKRGTCCGNDCRHCPFTERVKGNSEIKKEKDASK